jgi:Cellulase (glycosyl hydrolase family 5)
MEAPLPGLARALTVAALVVGMAMAAPGTGAGAATVTPPACGKATGPFSVNGTRVLDDNGQDFVSYGITVPGLQFLSWAQSRELDLEKIAATADYWCANTVRLQLSQGSLLGPGGTGFNRAYLTAIESEVSMAEHYHLVVVLNDNTEFAAPAVRYPGPTPATETFWKDLAAVYGNDPQVIFDLFNEPRTYAPGMSQAREWQLWLHGGWFGGVFYPLGMADLAAYVRNAVHAQNLFWIEGPDNSASFAGMVARGATLKVSGVVYALHHPGGNHDVATWDADLGYLVTTGVAPVVEGEWTNYEPAPAAGPAPPRTSCWPDAPAKVPEYLQYLATHGIGLDVYQLQPGYLIKSYLDMSGPTTINASTWSCASNAEAQPGQGAGSAVLAFFWRNNGPPA